MVIFLLHNIFSKSGCSSPYSPTIMHFLYAPYKLMNGCYDTVKVHDKNMPHSSPSSPVISVLKNKTLKYVRRSVLWP